MATKKKAKGTWEQAEKELIRMLDAVRRDVSQFEGIGYFRCKKKLADGTKVTICIDRPALE